MAEKEDIDKKDEAALPEEGNGDTGQKKKKAEKSHHKEEKENGLKELQAKIDEVNDKYVRLAAEFDNYRRRTARERLDLISTAGEDIIKGMLPVLDDCERALQVLRESGSDKAAVLSVIEAIGKELDTDFHEAVAQMPVQEADKKNKIIDVIQPGYKLNDKVIRFAKVVVGV